MVTKINIKNSQIVVILSIAIFVILQLTIFLYTYTPSDSPMYMYASKLISEGKLPYADFFFAHPPLQLYLNGLIIKLFGLKVTILRSLEVLGAIISSCLLYLIVKQNYDNLSATLSVIIFLFSPIIMYQASYLYGYFLILPLIIFAFLAYTQKKYFYSGIAFGLAGITRLLSLPAFFVIVIYSIFISENKNITNRCINCFKLIFGFCIVFIPVILFFFAKTSNFYDYIFNFQITRSTMPFENKLHELTNIVMIDKVVFLLPIVLSYFLFRKKNILALSIISIYLIFIFNLRFVFKEYFIVIYPFLIILGATSFADLMKSLKSSKKFHKFAKFSAPILLILIFVPAANHTLQAYKEVYVQPHQEFKSLSLISDYVKKNSNENILLYGGQPQTAYVAILSGRALALEDPIFQKDYYINNPYKLNQTIKNLEQLFQEHKIKFLVNTNEKSLMTIEDFPEYTGLMKKYCSRPVVPLESNFFVILNQTQNKDMLIGFNETVRGFIVYKCF